MSKITVEFLGKELTFENKEELRNQLKDAMKYIPKNSPFYAQLRMIELKYNL